MDEGAIASSSTNLEYFWKKANWTGQICDRIILHLPEMANAKCNRNYKAPELFGNFFLIFRRILYMVNIVEIGVLEL